MNADAVVAEVVKHMVEVKTEMNMKVIMKIMMMRTQMNTRETVIRIPVVTNMTGMRMMITAREEAGE